MALAATLDVTQPRRKRVTPLALAGVALVGGCLALDRAGVAAPSLAVMLVILLAATAASVAGFAFSAIAGAGLMHLLPDPVTAVEIMVVCSIAIQGYALLALWRSIDWRRLLPFLLGGGATVPLGLTLLLGAKPAFYAQAMGGFLVLYASYMALRRNATTVRGGAWSDALAGALGGITGGLAGFPGAAVTIWCGWRGWDKAAQRAVFQPYILAMQIVTLAGLALAGKGGVVHHLAALPYVPAALIGAACGLALFRRLNERQFRLMVQLLLIVSGLALLRG